MIWGDRARRLATLKQEILFLQHRRRIREEDSRLGAEVRAIYSDYYAKILQWLQEEVERQEASLRCADGSPSQRT